MTVPVFGIQFNLQESVVYPPAFADFSVLGIVCSSDNADPTVFPLNTPVDINTGDPTILAAAGSGDLYHTLNDINNQLAPLEVSARAVVVRVESGVDPAHSMANIIGDQAAQTGIYALLNAPQTLGVTPRLIICPGGFTGQFTYTPSDVTVLEQVQQSGNTGNGTCTPAGTPYQSDVQDGIYTVKCIGGATSAAATPHAGNTGNGTCSSPGTTPTTHQGNWELNCSAIQSGAAAFSVIRPDGSLDGVALTGQAYNSTLNDGISFTLTEGGTPFAIGDNFQVAVVASVPHAGGLFEVKDPFGNQLPEATVGVAYADQVCFTIAAGNVDFAVGDGFILTVTIVQGFADANPICAALPDVLDKLLAHAIVTGPGTNKTTAINWVSTMSSMRLIPVESWVDEFDTDGVTVVKRDGVGIVAGIGVSVDYSHNGFPFWSFSNQPVTGILGPDPTYQFSLVDGACDAQELLAAGIGCIVRGDNTDVSLTDSGFSLICHYNTFMTNTIWNLFNKSRGRDFIHLALLKSIRQRLGSTNITPSGVDAVLNDMIAVLNQIKANDCTIGFQVGFDPSKNTPEMLQAGQFRVFFEAQEPAPILLVTIDSGLDETALIKEIAALATTVAADQVTVQPLIATVS